MRTETLAADHGTIYDRNGVALAMSTPQKSIFADPALVSDPDGVKTHEEVAASAATLLAPILGRPAAELKASLTADNRFTYLARQVPPEVAEQIQALKRSDGPGDTLVDLVPGIEFIDEPKRSQPGEQLAKSIIGQIDIDGKGISGLEKRYADELTGQPGKVLIERDLEGRTIAAGEPVVVPAVRGRDLQLTLDRSLQFETERILTEQVAETGAKSGVAMVMKPDTGEILSMANVVSDDARTEVSIDSNNAAVTKVYEPGSVMKIVTAAGALEEGVVQPETRIP